MPRGSDTARCAICGRTEGSVELLASASGTLLCTDCAGRMGERVVTAHARRHRPLPTAVPRDIKRVLDDYVIEQEDAKRTLAVAVYSHYRRLAHPGTVGRVVADAEVRIIDEQGRELPPGEIGEVIGRVHGVGSFAYHADPEKTKRALKQGLVSPGDVGYFDEDGYLYLCDRSNDMIISGGVNIYPAQIEAQLQRMPEVADCAVFGIPDEEYGEAVCAVVQPQPGCDPTAAEVRSFLRQHVAGYMVPRLVEFLAELPREDSGKIFKRKLRQPHWEGAGRSI